MSDVGKTRRTCLSLVRAQIRTATTACGWVADDYDTVCKDRQIGYVEYNMLYAGGGSKAYKANVGRVRC